MKWSLLPIDGHWVIFSRQEKVSCSKLSYLNLIGYLPLFFKVHASLLSTLTLTVPKSRPPSFPLGKLISSATSYASAVTWIKWFSMKPRKLFMDETSTLRILRSFGVISSGLRALKWRIRLNEANGSMQPVVWLQTNSSPSVSAPSIFHCTGNMVLLDILISLLSLRCSSTCLKLNSFLSRTSSGFCPMHWILNRMGSGFSLTQQTSVSSYRRGSLGVANTLIRQNCIKKIFD